MRHLTMLHFEKEINAQLPTEPPWACPYDRCTVEAKDNLRLLRLQ